MRIKTPNKRPSVKAWSGAEWTVYMVRCRDGSLYTGIAKDVVKRLEAHNAGRGAAYTCSLRPVVLVHQEGGLTHSLALRREWEIKALPRGEKLKLLRTQGKSRKGWPRERNR